MHTSNTSGEDPMEDGSAPVADGGPDAAEEPEPVPEPVVEATPVPARATGKKRGRPRKAWNDLTKQRCNGTKTLREEANAWKEVAKINADAFTDSSWDNEDSLIARCKCTSRTCTKSWCPFFTICLRFAVGLNLLSQRGPHCAASGKRASGGETTEGTR